MGKLPEQANTEISLGRRERLERVFLAVADNDPTDAALAAEYFGNGGCLRDCLHEIEQIAGPSEYDQNIQQSRENYLKVALTRPNWRNRVARKRLLYETEEHYIDAVIAKIAAVIDADSGHEILAVRQLPVVVQRTKFTNSEALDPKNIAGNHLYLLLDTALQEHDSRRRLIAEHQQKSLKARITGNRALHLTVAGGILGASFVPELGVVPTPDEIITRDIERGLQGVSAFIFALDGPELLRLRYLDIKHRQHTHELQAELAASQALTDLTFRTIYGSSRYGSSRTPDMQVTGRFGTTDPKLNMKQMQAMGADFRHLHSDPGGKPYTAGQATSYAARFFIERQAQTAQLGARAQDPTAAKARYLEYCREIIQEDVNRMKAGLTVTRTRKDIMKAVGLLPAVILPSFVAGVSDATSLSQDVLHTISGGEDNTSQHDNN